MYKVKSKIKDNIQIKKPLINGEKCAKIIIVNAFLVFIMNHLSVREQIALTTRLDWRDAEIPIHPCYQNLLDYHSPMLRTGDYDGLMRVAQSWMERPGVFKYSLFDVLLQNNIKITLSKSKGVIVQNAFHGTDLKFTSSTCFGLANKMLILLRIAYPWVEAIFVENTKWKGTNGNHCYLVLSPDGFQNYKDEYLDTNLCFGDSSRYDSNTVIKDVDNAYVIDPTLQISGRINNFPDHDTEYVPKLGMWVGSNWAGTVRYPSDNTPLGYNHSYVYSTKVGSFSSYIGLGLLREESKPVHRLYWITNINNNSNGLLDAIEFDDVNIVSLLRRIDPYAAEQIMMIQNRGYTITE